MRKARFAELNDPSNLEGMMTSRDGTLFLKQFAVLSVLVCACSANDWPQWRGPHRNGISHETGLLKEWPKEGPKLLWQAKDVGGGYSTPAVVGDRFYLLSNKDLDQESVQARSVKDASVVWTSRI